MSNAIKRNNGLELKGKKIRVQWAKYARNTNRHATHTNSFQKQEVVPPQKQWRPAHRDHRTYSEVVKKKEIIEVGTDKEIEEWFGNALICYYKDGLNLKTAKEMLQYKGLGELVISSFDSFLCIISRVECMKDCPQEERTQQKLRKYFQHNIP